jgi:outer membrane protein
MRCVRFLGSVLLAIPCLAQGIGAQEPAPAANSDTSLHPIALQEAVLMAQKNAPAAVQARGQIQTSESAVRSAYGQFLPSLNLTAGQSQLTNGTQTIDPVTRVLRPCTACGWSYNAGLSSQITLFDGFQNVNNLRARRADVGAATSNEVAQQFSIALQVKTQFANILAARESESAARAQLEQAQQQLVAASAKVRAGAATMSDSLRSVIAVGNAQLALLTARNNLRVASASLTRLVGAPYLVTAGASDTLDRPMTAIDSAMLAQLAAEGPPVRQAESQLSSSKASLVAAKSTYLPTVTFRFTRNGNGSAKDAHLYGLGDGSLAYGSNWSLNFAFPVFNNFSREDTRTRAMVNADNAEASLRDARLAAQQNIIQQLGALRTAEEQIRINQLSVAAAEEDLRVQQQRYQLGASTLVELLTSQSGLNTARASLIQSRQNYRISRAQIEAIIGRDLQ